ncbi:hypothetical protein XdyCFBP7245_14300 [Xanthomonas dyei]|uniref:Uncharacterized protein n=1 Tax=Xanthomonas dyei TaxID=743699 RepID=A0A2S7C0Z9_9XANT|nr:hypothetical protein XdyCFBP7245_14300 [Xanthomonas dyei]
MGIGDWGLGIGNRESGIGNRNSICEIAAGATPAAVWWIQGYCNRRCRCLPRIGGSGRAGGCQGGFTSSRQRTPLVAVERLQP